jgi:mono/diheme cytochrome c family protein
MNTCEYHKRRTLPQAARVVGGAVLSLVLLFGNPSSLRAQDLSELESRGFAIVSEKCASCHAIARSDISPYPKAPPFRILSRHYPTESLAEAFAEGIIVGHVDMPEFKFRPEEIDGVIAYLKYVQVPAPR